MFNSCQDNIFTDNVIKQKELSGIPQFSNQEQFLLDINNYEATKVLPQTMSNIKTLSSASSLKSDNIEEEIEEDTLVYSDLLKEFLNDKYEIIIGDGRTFAGKSWDLIWGFSKSVRNYFDSKHRVDVKFYAQDFVFYSEMGIKTKYQRRGGSWRGVKITFK